MYFKKMSLSSSSLKIIAITTMVIDHIGIVFFPQVTLFRIIGRISFPLFALMIAEGYTKTSNVHAYFKRLLIFSLVSQFPFMLMVNYTAGISYFILNIFFTLSAGLLVVMFWNKLPLKQSLPIIITIAIFAEVLHFDYGAYGVLTVLASSIFLQHRTLGTLLLILLPQLYTVLLLQINLFTIQFLAPLSIPFIILYNRKIGMRLPQTLLYWFYPGHLLLLWLLWMVLK